jgi:hypothetical protein
MDLWKRFSKRLASRRNVFRPIPEKLLKTIVTDACVDQDLKDALVYGFGTVAAFCTFIAVLIQVTRDLQWIVNYTLLLVILVWLMYIQTKLTRISQEGIHVKRRA